MSKTKNRKKALEKYGELTFINEHVDTFYMGLNDDYRNHAENPLQAKVVNADNESVMKDWVHPDSQLAKSIKRPLKNANIKKSSSTSKINHMSNLSEKNSQQQRRHYKPLVFVQLPKTGKENAEVTLNRSIDYVNLNRSVDYVIAQNSHDQTIEFENAKPPSLLKGLFESDDERERVKDTQVVRMIAPDTPVEHYNTSVFQRRRLGLNF